MIDLIKLAVSKGAELDACISGGKDSQAMVKTMILFGLKPDNLVHCDLGVVEWPESITQCERLSAWENIPLHIVKRKDGVSLLDHWKNRMNKVQGKGIPFWSSSKNRYCTSDMKRDPSDNWFRSRPSNFIISCEGIRADESTGRSKKNPLTIRERITSSFYRGMSVEEAIANYRPDKRLALTWYPIFNFSTEDVWSTYGNSQSQLEAFRAEYRKTDLVNMGNINDPTWNFHPAYVYGNERVSCMICILGSMNDIKNGVKHNPVLFEEMVSMEKESGFSFREKLSLSDITL